MSNWKPYPHDNIDYDYDLKQLKKRWPALHKGDGEAWPDNKPIQSIWQHYHAGRFGEAIEAAVKHGPEAYAPHCKAMVIYADHLEDNESEQQKIYQQAVDIAEQALDEYPDDPNSHYLHAFALGRFAQSISVAKALSQGLGGKIGASLKTCAELNPEHSEVHVALGLYHAEIIDKVGKLVGKMTYGASEDKALEHLELALKLNPDAPITQIEYGNGIYVLYGDKRIDDANDAYRKAAQSTPRDAIEKLDQEFAASEVD